MNVIMYFENIRTTTAHFRLHGGTVVCKEKEKIRLPAEGGAYNEMHIQNRDGLIFQSLNDYQVLYYSRSKNILTRTAFKRLDKRGFYNTDRTWTFNDSVYFCSQYENRVLNLSDGAMKEVFRWDFGKYNNTKSVVEATARFYEGKQGMDVAREAYTSYKKNHIWRCHENGRYRIALVDHADKYLNVFWDKTDDRRYVFTHTVEGITFYGAQYSGDYLIIPSDKWMRFEDRDLTSYNPDLLSESDREIIERHDPETQNPYLIIYRLKNK